MITARAKHGTITAGHRSRLVQWLREHPGKQSLKLAAKACSIPYGSMARVLADHAFARYRGGFVALASEKLAGVLAQPLHFTHDTITQARWAVFAELSIDEPQTVSQLVARLKFDRALIERAVEWKRLEKVFRGYRIAGSRKTYQRDNEPEEIDA